MALHPFFLILLLFSPLYCQTRNYVAISGSTITTSLGSFQNIVYCTISNSPIIQPFQYIQQLAKGRVRVSYNFTNAVVANYGSGGSFGQGKPEYLYSYNDSRCDTEDAKFDLEINATVGRNSSTYNAYLEVRYDKNDGSGILWVVWFFWNSPGFSCPASPMVSISGVSYSVVPAFPRVYLYSCIAGVPYTNTTLDVSALTTYLISNNWLKPYSIRQSLKFIYANNGSGEYEFYGRMYKVRDNKLSDYGELLKENYYIYQKITNTTNTRSLEFSNMSLDSTGYVISGTTYEFMFNSSVPAMNTAQSECFVAIGYKDTTWLTPRNQYLLPALVTRRLILTSTFNYSQYPSTDTSARKSACFMISLRDDYNPLTGFFNNATSNPSFRIYICLYCSNNLQILSNEINILSLIDGTPRIVSFHGVNFRVVKGNDVAWPAYVFYAMTNITSAVGYDLFGFVRYLRDVEGLLAGMYVIGAAAGFRGYTGRGGFTFNKVSFDSVEIPNDNVYSNYKFDFSDPISPQPVACPIGWSYPYLSACVLFEPETNDLAVETLLNARGLSLLTRISPFASLIDEFIYYNYHNQSYDRGIRILSKICRNWTSSKYLLPGYFAKGDDDIGPKVGASGSNQTASKPAGLPNKYSQKMEWPRFLENTYDFWILPLPVSIGCFLILMAVEYLIRQCWMAKEAQYALRILRPYRSIVYLWSGIFCDNLTYLSFKCFLNLYSFTPFQRDGKLGLTLFSMCFCLVILFLTLLTVIGIALFANKYSRKRLFLPKLPKKPKMRKSFPICYILFTLLLITKFLSGFIHVFISDPQSRCILLFCLSLSPFLICFILNIKLKLKQLNILAPVVIFICKLFMHMLLMIETQYNLGFMNKVANEEYMWNALTVLNMIAFWIMVLAEGVYKVEAWIVWGRWKLVRVKNGNGSEKSIKSVKSILKSKVRIDTSGDKPQEQTKEQINDIRRHQNSFQFRMNYSKFRERIQTQRLPSYHETSGMEIKKSLNEIQPQPRTPGVCTHKQCSHNHLPAPPKSERLKTKYAVEGKKWTGHTKAWH